MDESKCFGAVFGWWLKSYGILFFLVCECVFGSVNKLKSNLFFAEIEVVHLYQPFGAKLKVFLAISQGEKVMSAWWL